MNCSIFIPTFRRDLPYLEMCLKSIRKFGTGIHEVVVDMPEWDVELFAPLMSVYNCRTAFHRGETPANGGLWQQLVKLRADEKCPEAEIILYVDSDCCFLEPFSPYDYIDPKWGTTVRPVLCIKPWLESSHDEQVAWWRSTEENLGFKCEWNTMLRHPAAHHAWVLPLLRDYIEKRHGKRFDEFVLSRDAGIRPGISEFNVFGSFVRQFYPHEYHLIDISKEGRPKDKLFQGWSRKGVRPEDLEVWKRLGLV